MRCEIVTPAGRKRYLEILYLYLKSQKAEFDIWQLWVNTVNEKDIEYMNKLAAENDWIQLYSCRVPVDGNRSISSFFGDNVRRPDTIYIRLDDDIVYLSPNFIGDLKSERLINPVPLLIYPNIINNAAISYLHFQNKLISYDKNPSYDSSDNIGWGDPIFAEKVHEAFLDSIQSNNIDQWRQTFHYWSLSNYLAVSINCICWFGAAMIYNIGFPEEQYLASLIPTGTQNPHLIVNGPICAHYAFYPQRDHLEKNTNILQRYREIAERTVAST